MISKVLEILNESTIRIEDKWSYSGLQGNVIKIVGIKPANRQDKEEAINELNTILINKQIEIVENWYVKGNQLVAIITLEKINIADYLPNRKSYIIEPSRKLKYYDSDPLARVSGGLPKLWSNPLVELEDTSIPFFKEIIYPVQWWLPDYSKTKKLIDHLYVNKDITKLNNEKIEVFRKIPGPAVMIVSGECGTGKTWFTIKNFIENRPKGSDFAYVDLRGRPAGDDLKQAISREIGLYLDKFINEKIDVFIALRHYFEPMVKPLFPHDYDITKMPVREAIKEAYKQIAFSPEKLTDYNDIRLGYYDNSESTIYIVIDNLDNYPEDEQLIVYDSVIRYFHGHHGVKIVVPLRPSSKLMIERLRQGLDFMPLYIELKSPKIFELLSKRLSISISGNEIKLEQNVSGTDTTWINLLNRYINSQGANLIMDLCSYDYKIPISDESDKINTEAELNSYDCRHFLRLFRRVLFSDVLIRIENICNEYFSIHALLLRPNEPFSPETSYLYNLFDNGDPELSGNALIRYRILEYFHHNQDYNELFDIYFRALGTSPRVAKEIVKSFVNAGLLSPSIQIEDDKEIWEQVFITNSGRRHFSIIRNLWYGICVKTGMYIEPNLIRRGKEARDMANGFVNAEKLLDFYAENGWVSDVDFIKFLWKQEALESLRIGEFQESNLESARLVANLIKNRTSPGDMLSYEYAYQLHNWKGIKDKKNER